MVSPVLGQFHVVGVPVLFEQWIVACGNNRFGCEDLARRWRAKNSTSAWGKGSHEKWAMAEMPTIIWGTLLRVDTNAFQSSSFTPSRRGHPRCGRKICKPGCRAVSRTSCWVSEPIPDSACGRSHLPVDSRVCANGPSLSMSAVRTRRARNAREARRSGLSPPSSGRKHHATRNRAEGEAARASTEGRLSLPQVSTIRARWIWAASIRSCRSPMGSDALISRWV